MSLLFIVCRLWLVHEFGSGLLSVHQHSKCDESFSVLGERCSCIRQESTQFETSVATYKERKINTVTPRDGYLVNEISQDPSPAIMFPSNTNTPNLLMYPNSKPPHPSAPRSAPTEADNTSHSHTPKTSPTSQAARGPRRA